MRRALPPPTKTHRFGLVCLPDPQVTRVHLDDGFSPLPMLRPCLYNKTWKLVSKLYSCLSFHAYAEYFFIHETIILKEAGEIKSQINM